MIEQIQKFVISVDPASTKKKKSDYTVILIHEIDTKGKFHLIDGLRDKLNVEERVNAVFDFVKKYEQKEFKIRPLVTYETIGFQLSDVENINRKQREDKYYFTIQEVKTTTSSKQDRIRSLQPLYFNKQILWKKTIIYQSKWDGKTHDLIQEIKLEFLQFPFSTHDDIMDCQSQLMQINVTPPKLAVEEKKIGDWTFSKIQKTIKTFNNLRNIQSNRRFSDDKLYQHALGWR